MKKVTLYEAAEKPSLDYIQNYKHPLQRKFRLTAVVYIIAALSECIWFYTLYQNWDALVRWVNELPFLGWMFVAIFIGMILATFVLFLIGVRLLRMVQKAEHFFESYRNRTNRRNINMLLIVGILVDLVIPAIIQGSADKSAIIFVCAIFGCRILMANILAIQVALSTEKGAKNTTSSKTLTTQK